MLCEVIGEPIKLTGKRALRKALRTHDYLQVQAQHRAAGLRGADGPAGYLQPRTRGAAQVQNIAPWGGQRHTLGLCSDQRHSIGLCSDQRHSLGLCSVQRRSLLVHFCEGRP